MGKFISAFKRDPGYYILFGIVVLVGIVGVASVVVLAVEEEAKLKAQFKEKYVRTIDGCTAKYVGSQTVRFNCLRYQGDIVAVFRKLHEEYPEIHTIEVQDLNHEEYIVQIREKSPWWD